MGEMAFDKELRSNFPMPCYDNPPSPTLCTQATILFQSEIAMEADSGTVCVPVEGSYRTHLCDVRAAQLVVTRVDVALAHDSADDFTDLDPALMVVSFEDGSDQVITLSATLGLRSYYIRPVVSSFVTFRAIPRTDGKTIRVAELDVVGQNLGHVFGPETYVDITYPGYAAPNGGTYMCPPTTFATMYERPGLSALFWGCAVCPYPTGSIEGSTHLHNCSCPVCGDSKVSWQSTEQCDDGNVAVNDGCSADCQIEPLQLCQGPKSIPEGVGLPVQSYDTADECFRLGSEWTDYGLAPWAARYGHGVVIHSDAMWIVGGISTDATQFFNDVWYEESNGGACVAPEPDEEEATPPYTPCLQDNGLGWFPGRKGLIASHAGYKNESFDTYLRLKTFPPRGYHGLVEHEGFIWVLGGAHRRNWPTIPPHEDTTGACTEGGGATQGLYECAFDETFNDVWKTSKESASDVPGGFGVAWECVQQNVQSESSNVWEARYQHSVVSWQGSIWVVAGGSINAGSRLTQHTLHNDLWRTTGSESGALTWERVGRDDSCTTATLATCMRKRRGQAVAVLTRDVDGNQVASKLILFGGLTVEGDTDVYLNDVWQTNGVCETDAKCWERVKEYTDWPGRYLHSGLVYQNSLWVVGGQYCGGPIDSNGQKSTEAASNGVRGSVGGESCGKLAARPPTQLGDVWVSSGLEVGATQAGQMWNQATSQAGWGRRSAHAMVVFDNRDWKPAVKNARNNLWVLGGMDGHTDAHNQCTISFEF